MILCQGYNLFGGVSLKFFFFFKYTNFGLNSQHINTPISIHFKYGNLTGNDRMQTVELIWQHRVFLSDWAHWKSWKVQRERKKVTAFCFSSARVCSQTLNKQPLAAWNVNVVDKEYHESFKTTALVGTAYTGVFVPPPQLLLHGNWFSTHAAFTSEHFF